MIRQSSLNSVSILKKVIYSLVLAIIAGIFSFGVSLSPATAAQADEAVLYGVVTDKDDLPLPGIGISVIGPDGFEDQVLTDAEGAWRIVTKATGVYEISIDENSLPKGQGLTNPERATVKVSVFMLGIDLAIQFPIGVGVVKATRLERAPQLALDGLILGLIIGLAALGLNLIFGTTGLTNFAHGEILTMGGIITYYLSLNFGLSLIIAIPLAILITAAVAGWAQNQYLWKPLRRRGTGLIAMLVVSIGFAIFIRYFFLFIFGGGTKQLPQYAGQAGLDLGLVSITPKSIITTIFAIIFLILATLWLLKTKMGKASRAVADNPALASASGIDVEKVIRSVWILGAALAAYAGIILTTNQGVSFLMGQDTLLLIFAAVTLGGLGTANGALIGSLIIGLMVQLSTLFIPTELKYVGALVVLILILIIRPQGILGKKDRIG
ncbi:MAG: branched-chain amino acid ABC transporter permease [Actinomycetota bacterium]|nr:branched-chain amino acid ABC transporter permease [Actinomycetota bacterium]